MPAAGNQRGGVPQRRASPGPAPCRPRPDQWEPGMLAGGRCGRVATVVAGRLWALPEECPGVGGGGAMEGLEGEEVKGRRTGGWTGPVAVAGPWTLYRGGEGSF